jgi:hypothetical protein
MLWGIGAKGYYAFETTRANARRKCTAGLFFGTLSPRCGPGKEPNSEGVRGSLGLIFIDSK